MSRCQLEDEVDRRGQPEGLRNAEAPRRSKRVTSGRWSGSAAS